jgi:uncharacterized protein YbaP (TraB family)
VSRKSTFALAAAFILSATAAFLLFIQAPAGHATTPSPAIWKIDGPNGRVYLFGSIHILPKDYVWRSPALENVLTVAQRLVFEINVDDARDPIFMMGSMAQAGMLEKGESLHRMMAPERREQLDRVVRSVGLDPRNVDRMKPWLAALIIGMRAAIARNATPGEQAQPSERIQAGPGVDDQLWRWSKTSNKERGALETVNDQLHVFADLPPDEQMAYLVVTLDEISKPPQKLMDMFEAWRAGNTGALERDLNSGVNRFPALRKAILHDRHVKWIPQIERMLTDGRTHLVVVGTAHLIGEGSVVAMLRAKGIRVEGP